MMRIIHRHTPLSAILAFAILLPACDEDTPPEARVATLTAAAGDDQNGTVGAALPQALVVRAVDNAGSPVSGARVVWAVTTGGGSIAATTQVTDQDGRAQAIWTLGTGAGGQTATAQVGSISTQFDAEAQAGPAVSVAVDPATVQLDAIGATETLDFVAEDQYGNAIEGRTPTWISLNTGIVSVTPAGVVMALAPGSANVRATLDGASGEAEVTVMPVVASIDIDPDAPVLPSVGSTVQLQARALDSNGNEVADAGTDYVWSSSAGGIVSVNATGLARAEAAGSAEIMAALDGVIGQVTVTVSQVATTLDVTPPTDTLTTAAPTVQLGVVARDANNNVIATPSVTWTSSNNTIAVVSPAGLVTAVSNGVAQIRGVSGTARDSATITVLLNSAPKPVADVLGASQNTPLVVAAPGVLANDTLGIPAAMVSSFGGGSLGGIVTTNAAGTAVAFGTGGSLQVNANGSVNFTPSTGFTGNFTFQYRAQNAAGSGDATVTIQVGIAPVATDDNFATALNTVLSVNAASGLLANDQAGLPTGTVTSFGGGSHLPGTVTTFATGSLIAFGVGGSLLVNADGSITFKPPTGFTGTFTFNYRLSNSAGTSDAVVSIVVS